jgi:DNA-directed RNA polymerase subunit M/transcription elongation factor TFIIS
MSEHRPEVADVFREHGAAYLKQSAASRDQRRVLKDISLCKTAALGGHKATCDRCGHEECFYNSCRNRHCPKCQGAARAKWLAAREAELLNTHYFHVVFTLPDELGPLALQNKRLVYGLLFRAAAETLRTIAADPKHLGAEIGFLAVLHTWGQRLDHHPHVHCVVPGGGFSPDRSRWISARETFFLPVKVLSKRFRHTFLSYLTKAFQDGELKFHGRLADLREPLQWGRFIEALPKPWVVYSKPPFGGPELVLKYLARYTHRVAISNQRLVSLKDGKATFRYKDYHADAERTMTLEATEFIRRFLLHVLPSGFQRIRHYGFLANRVRKDRIALCGTLLPAPQTALSQGQPPSSDDTPDPSETPQRDPLCPACKEGRLTYVQELSRNLDAALALLPWMRDTS